MKKLVLFAVALLLFSLMGCTASNSPSKDKTKELLSYNEVAEVKTISILNGSGTINVEKGTTDKVEIECFVSYGGKSAKDAKKIVEQFSLSPQITEDVFFLK